MKCPECILNDMKSVVVPGGRRTTCMGFTPYYDEDGKYHCHDPNVSVLDYRCSNGHIWTRSRLSKCPSCDYGLDNTNDNIIS